MGYESSRSSSLEVLEPVSKKRKFKWREDTVPRSRPKRTKTPSPVPKKLELKTNLKSQSSKVTEPSKPQQKKKIEHIFTAEAARRAREEAEEIARVKEIQDSMTVNPDYGIATCARCSKWFEKGGNTEESCVFHPGELFPACNSLSIAYANNNLAGVRRRYHLRHKNLNIHNCCGRFYQEPGCRHAKHVDIKRPGVVERLAKLREMARKEAAKTMYGHCFGCRDDVEIDEVVHGDDHRPEDLLCGACEEEANKVETSCGCCRKKIRVSLQHLDGEDVYCEECEEMLEERRMMDDDPFSKWGYN